MRTWITPEEAAPHTPWKSRANIYERIREGKFPFRFKRSGRAILIFALDLGLTPDNNANETAREGDQSFDAAAPAHA